MLTKRKKLLIAFYILSIFSVVAVVFSKTAIINAQCTGNYLVFVAGNSWWIPYTLAYFAILISGILSITVALSKKRFQWRDKDSKTLLWILVGYLSFLIPTAIVYIFMPEARHAIPSVMCGFAILFAFILVFKVLPDNKEK
ncbi:MAG: hypothetical protein AAB628_00620 [Patescibacteria group bacterium]